MSLGVELLKKDDGTLAVRSENGTTEYRGPDEWNKIVTASLNTKVTIDGGMNDGDMTRHEIACTVNDPECSVFITGKIFIELCGDSLAQALLSTLPKTATPTTLADFGYELDSTGRLRALAEGLPHEGFIFLNDTHFTLVRQAKLRQIWDQLGEEFGMRARQVPGDPINGTVYCTDDLETNALRLLVMIPGLGYGRPGIFGRNLSVYGGEECTILPLVRRARADGFAVLILDPNAGMEEPIAADQQFASQEWWLSLGRDQVILNERDADYHMNEHYKKGHSWGHTRAVWDALVVPSAAASIAVMAHSAGGSCLISVLQDDHASRERVKAVAFCDCYELEGDPKWDYELLKPFMKEVVRGWYIGNDAPLNTPIEWIPNMYSCSDDLEFDCVSSGCTAHNLIPFTVTDSMFTFFESKLA